MRRTTVLAIFVMLVGGCAHHTAGSTDGRGTVARVVDGDTIVVHIGRHEENVRLLGIDTSTPQKTPLRVWDAAQPLHPSVGTVRVRAIGRR